MKVSETRLRRCNWPLYRCTVSRWLSFVVIHLQESHLSFFFFSLTPVTFKMDSVGLGSVNLLHVCSAIQ